MSSWGRNAVRAAQGAWRASQAAQTAAADCRLFGAWPLGPAGGARLPLGALPGVRSFLASSPLCRGIEPRDATPARHSWQQVEKPPGWGSGGGGAPPFTPSSQLVKVKSLFKRAAHMMEALESEASAARAAARPLPPFRVGDVVDVSLSVPENKGRPSAFRGLVIARRSRGLASSFRLRSVVNNFVVERSFPLYSPHLTQLTVVERRKVARGKLFYLRRKPIAASRVPGGGGAGGAARSAVQGSEARAAPGKGKPGAARKK